jgi:hypothetical protein
MATKSKMEDMTYAMMLELTMRDTYLPLNYQGEMEHTLLRNHCIIFNVCVL